MNRVHDEFIWLHDQLEENGAFAGLIVSIGRYFLTLLRLDRSPQLLLVLISMRHEPNSSASARVKVP